MERFTLCADAKRLCSWFSCGFSRILIGKILIKSKSIKAIGRLSTESQQSQRFRISKLGGYVLKKALRRFIRSCAKIFADIALEWGEEFEAEYNDYQMADNWWTQMKSWILKKSLKLIRWHKGADVAVLLKHQVTKVKRTLKRSLIILLGFTNL